MVAATVEETTFNVVFKLKDIEKKCHTVCNSSHGTWPMIFSTSCTHTACLS